MHVAMMKLLRILRKEFAELKHSDQFALALIGAASMSHQGIVPIALGDTVLIKFIEKYRSAVGAGSLRFDQTKFGHSSIALFAVCQTDEFRSSIEKKLDDLVKAISAFDQSAALNQILAPGWFHQCAVKNASINRNLVDGHRVRAELTDLPALTQWFTPDWIANYLVEESLDQNPDGFFLDPACGAGHLLVPALRQMMELKRNSKKKCSAETAIEQILANQLFALDVDSDMINLSKLALYMTARDCAELVELPMMNVFTCGDSEAAQAIGSLRLGIKSAICSHNPASTDTEAGLRSSRDAGFVSSPDASSRHVPDAFDAIAMNPPYLGHRTMPQMTREFLKTEYPDSQYDLYAAFLELGLRLLKSGGKLAAICQQSVLTIQRYQALREMMLETTDIESVAQLGAGAFTTKAGEKTNTAVITLRKRGTSKQKDVRCWQLLTRKEHSLAASRGIQHFSPNIITRADADALAKILPQSPYSFWAPQEILQLFSRHPSLIDPANGIACTNGLFTCNNEKFVRRFDDIPADIRHEFVPYDKGGGHKWYRTSPLMLHWKTDGQEIRDYRVKRGQSAKMPGEQFYFTEGVTYSYIGTRGFKARLLTPDAVFDIASSAVFSTRINTLFILGFLNSSLVRSILGILNPTVNFQIGDIRRIPFIVPSTEIERAVSDLSERAVAIAKELETFDESSPRFRIRLDGCNASAIKSTVGYRERCEQWVEEESSIQNELDKIIFELYSISTPCRRAIESDPWVARGADAFRKATMSTCKQPV